MEFVKRNRECSVNRGLMRLNPEFLVLTIAFYRYCSTNLVL